MIMQAVFFKLRRCLKLGYSKVALIPLRKTCQPFRHASLSLSKPEALSGIFGRRLKGTSLAALAIITPVLPKARSTAKRSRRVLAVWPGKGGYLLLLTVKGLVLHNCPILRFHSIPGSRISHGAGCECQMCSVCHEHSSSCSCPRGVVESCHEQTSSAQFPSARLTCSQGYSCCCRCKT